MESALEKTVKKLLMFLGKNTSRASRERVTEEYGESLVLKKKE